eukprot:6596573-Alexandrium_andersonii.AAC.1
MAIPSVSTCLPSASIGRADEPNQHRCWIGSVGAGWALMADPRGAGLRLRMLPPRGWKPYATNREYRGQTQQTPTMESNAHFP